MVTPLSSRKKGILGVKAKVLPIFGLLTIATFTFFLLTVWRGYYLIVTSRDYDDNTAKIGKGIPSQQQSPVAVENNSKQEPIKIAHAISLITCNKASRVRGFLDALVILRHSIHLNSVHAHPNSKYSYQMFAIIHEDSGCVDHVPLLQRLGYITLVKPTPVDITAITHPEGKYYRDHVENENCCGSKEFIKLYAYTLMDYPVVVHWDLDVAVLQPMDDLYDAMIYDKDSPEGKRARSRLQIQRPQSQTIPHRIDAFYTRDVTSAQPWEKVEAVQGGFLVARPNLKHFQMYQDFIMKADYKPGRGPESGWGGLGYGGFQGAMAYQGVLAYFYEQVYPGYSVELDVCRWNQVVADVIWRGPNKMEHEGQCRQYPVIEGDFENNTPENGQCEDCRILPIEETNTVHYTACKKPWECTVPTPRVPGAKMKQHAYRLQQLTNVTTCGKLFSKYFEMRRDIEEKVSQKAGTALNKPNGQFHPEFFGGYCQSRGNYISMDELPTNFYMKEVYGF